MPALLNFYALDKITNNTQLPGMYQGSNWGVTFSDPVPYIDVTGATPSFTIKLDSDEAIDLSQYANFTAGDWPLAVYVPYTVTADLTPGKYEYQIKSSTGECLSFGELPVREQVK